MVEFVHCYKYSEVDLPIIMCIRMGVALVYPIYPPLFAFQREHSFEVSCLLTLLVRGSLMVRTRAVSDRLRTSNFRSRSEKTFLAVYMLRMHIVLLIAIRPSDGDVTPDGPLGAFRLEQAMSWHRISPCPFLLSSSHTPQHNYTIQNSYTYSHPNLNFL